MPPNDPASRVTDGRRAGVATGRTDSGGRASSRGHFPIETARLLRRPFESADADDEHAGSTGPR